MTEFEGFPEAGLELLAALPSRDKAWFDAHRKDYSALLADPLKAFAAGLGAELRRRVSPGLIVQPKTNGSISPINNDLRFRPDASPYKDHVMVSFWEGPTKKTAPTLRVRVSADDVGFGCGAAFDPAMVERWREALDDEATGGAIATAIASLVERHDADVAGAALKRVPKPYGEDHPRAALLKHKALQVRWPEPLFESVRTAAFIDDCATRVEEFTTVHRWLCDNIGEGQP